MGDSLSDASLMLKSVLDGNDDDDLLLDDDDDDDQDNVSESSDEETLPEANESEEPRKKPGVPRLSKCKFNSSLFQN